MRQVGLEFLETATVKYVTEAALRAPREIAWRTFVDASTWSKWWPGVRHAEYPGQPTPYGVGTRRAATVGGMRVEETMVAWDVGERWAYYIDRATVPLAYTQLECTEFEDYGSGTRLRWTIALEPRLLMKIGAPVFPRIMADLFKKAMRNLDEYIERR